MKKFKLKLKNPARELEGKFYTVECVFWVEFRMGQSREDFGLIIFISGTRFREDGLGDVLGETFPAMKNSKF